MYSHMLLGRPFFAMGSLEQSLRVVHWRQSTNQLRSLRYKHHSFWETKSKTNMLDPLQQDARTVIRYRQRLTKYLTYASYVYKYIHTHTLYIYICMYVCMYVCLYVCMYVRMYVYIYIHKYT